MLFGQISSPPSQPESLPAPLLKALTYLRQTDFSQVAPGRHEITGEQIFAIVQDYQTEPQEQRRAETHRRFIDIQYLASGTEMIGFAPAGPDHEISEDCLAEKDALFYSRVAGETELILKPGDYAVFFPGEVHRPCCCRNSPEMVRKVVVKVAADLIDRS